MKPKRVAIISDLHCGHKAGLTPPHWQLTPADTTGKRNKWVKVERALWREYDRRVKAVGPVDLLIVAGDCIDGRGPKTGGTELITTNRDEQCEMAEYCINRWQAKKIVMVYGTDYHTGEYEDYEDQIAKAVKAAKIGAHEWVSVNGLVFDIKHFISVAEAPHTSMTPVMRDALWNQLWVASREQPDADIIIRAHVHTYQQFKTALWAGITMPALQGLGCRFGSRKCSRRVDWGFVWFDVTDKHNYVIHEEIAVIKEQLPKVIKI
jgi:hypothetical protein